MKKLWIVLAVFVTASMASAAYGAGSNGVSVNVAPVTKVTNNISNTTVTQVANGIVAQVQTVNSIALHGNANATASTTAVNTVITKAAIIKFGHSSAMGQ